MRFSVKSCSSFLRIRLHATEPRVCGRRRCLLLLRRHRCAQFTIYASISSLVIVGAFAVVVEAVAGCEWSSVDEDVTRSSLLVAIYDMLHDIIWKVRTCWCCDLAASRLACISRATASQSAWGVLLAAPFALAEEEGAKEAGACFSPFSLSLVLLVSFCFF